ncbi:MAG TPA: hypothetical protein VIF09_08870 [Polyangiaceae bacterium]
MKARFCAIASLVSLALAACSASHGGSGGADEPTGEATAAITVVPSGVQCVDINVVQGDDARAVDQRFTVTPGQGAVLKLVGLPLGAVTFSGLAYPVACSAVTTTTAATWATAPASATLQSGVVASVAMEFQAAGSVEVGVSFADAGAWPITIAPASVTFPPATCGTVPAAQTVSVTNVSSASVTVAGSVSDPSPMAISPASLTLAAGKTGTLTLTATAPTSAGTIGGQLTLVTNVTGDSPHVLPIVEHVSGSTFAFESATGAAQPTLSWGSTVQGTGTATTYLNGGGTASPGTLTVVVTPGSANLAGAQLLINGAAASSWRGAGEANTLVYSLVPPAGTPCGAVFTFTVSLSSNLAGVCGTATQTLSIAEGNSC